MLSTRVIIQQQALHQEGSCRVSPFGLSHEAANQTSNLTSTTPSSSSSWTATFRTRVNSGLQHPRQPVQHRGSPLIAGHYTSNITLLTSAARGLGFHWLSKGKVSGHRKRL